MISSISVIISMISIINMLCYNISNMISNYSIIVISISSSIIIYIVMIVCICMFNLCLLLRPPCIADRAQVKERGP